MATEPNHHVKYDEWELDMFISPIQLARARTKGTYAQGYICDDFRKACEEAYGSDVFKHHDGDIKWDELSITVLPAAAQLPTGKHVAS